MSGNQPAYLPISAFPYCTAPCHLCFTPDSGTVAWPVAWPRFVRRHIPARQPLCESLHRLLLAV